MVQGLCANTISVEDASSSSSQRLNFFAQKLVLDLAQALATVRCVPAQLATSINRDMMGFKAARELPFKVFRVAGQSAGRIILFLKDKHCEVLIAIWPARPHSPPDLARER